MKKAAALIVPLGLLLVIHFSIPSEQAVDSRLTMKPGQVLKHYQKPPKLPGKRPSDWFAFQRTYPYGTFSAEKQSAMHQYATRAQANKAPAPGSRAVVWQQAGPTNIPGRITDVEAHPSNTAIVYAGSAAGGIFKSTDYGQNWSPIFDVAGTPSIGDLAIHPVDPNIIYAGTGEANPAGDTYEGTGVFKSTDAGVNWTNVGLPFSYKIGRVVIDALRPETVFVAVGGRHMGEGNPERGVYRSVNGGGSWEQKLFVNDSTSCIDIAFFPETGVVLAAMWEKMRYVDQPTQLGGYHSAIHRSDDFGETWSITDFGLPYQSDLMGRIGLSVDPASSTAYALYSDRFGDFAGVYKSTDEGDIWGRVDDAALENLNASWGGGWYFGQIRCAPGNPDIIFAMGLEIYKSSFGGNDWSWKSASIHVDQHAMWINPNDPTEIYSGCD
ncbi:MAG: hypothetical protein V3T31_07395, partial [candidate division Zixibacteria bacterium]